MSYVIATGWWCDGTKKRSSVTYERDYAMEQMTGEFFLEWVRRIRKELLPAKVLVVGLRCITTQIRLLAQSVPKVEPGQIVVRMAVQERYSRSHILRRMATWWLTTPAILVRRPRLPYP